MKIQALILSAALVFPMTIAAQSSNKNPQQTWKDSTQLSHQDSHFLNKLATEDQSEIDLAHLALQKSNNAQIKNYAKSKILADDPPMEQQAKQIAQQYKSSVSATPSSMQTMEYKQLSKLSGKQFNKAYVKYECRKQAADLHTVQNEVATASNPRVAKFATNEENPVKMASQSANRIAHNLNVS